ncbi:MAG: hypothetical protein UW81_C0022G0013 [Candidatus Giovannonibacteria bacterium GW2011_GWC2_44_9]|uniref:Uncharacterized protein n=3 Tax=Candidatus Giovannoniibacteriota TaxID=1752738 RepID=A0A0G1IYQ2_9BACT|nr:MAG: hypothetical protein UW49_C0007G0100 [Candidatus Giovannonibacteria bacterium GW2011_GWB1_44_23]KKT64103.1 MAG: hypothetical protein UW57_C0003G0097 [Candidatus Giovannonibacteria bacterium GW2011_GWA1_44_29]KKT83283.1 MAG: hypothetical protein UW81_C0022G0013 [Candidatus Giovannonibacteria bacterium GW2011_GWC2_44_9]KKT91953.1 MAG: hypothetical protein UW93_C0002G0100 [Parcubacteria group bacterium GW2011_GWC1_45_13]
MKREVKKVNSLEEIGALMTNNGGVDVSDVEALMKGLDDDAIEHANAAFVEGVAKQMEAIAKGEDVYRAAAEKLQNVEARIKKMTENNTHKDIFEDTPPVMKLRAVAAQLKEMMQKASDADKKNPFATKLLQFQRVHNALKELVKKGNEVLDSLKAGKDVGEKVVEELKNGFARHLYRFVEEDGWMELVQEKQLKEWATQHQSFGKAAVSWTVKDCPDHHRQYCDHWYWGANEQGVALCQALGTLDGVNTRIREFLKKKKSVPVSK